MVPAWLHGQAFWYVAPAIGPGALFWGAGLLWPLALSIALAAAVVAFHEPARRLVPADPIPIAEVATGALWGLLILAA